MVFSKKEVLGLIKKKQIEITPFDPSCVGAVSVDLHLGGSLRVFRRSHLTFNVEEETYFSKKFQGNTRVVALGAGGYVLKPGHLVLGTTLENIRLSGNVSGKLEGRSRFARMGLMVHVSSSLVQPGVNNVQVLEILNVSPFDLVLKQGTKICQIVFDDVSSRAEYRGRFRKQRSA